MSDSSEQIITQATEDGDNTIIIPTRKFGRLASVDLRDHDHLMRMPRRKPGITARMWGHLAAMDQGFTSECVAFAMTQYLTTGPVKNRRKHRETNVPFAHDFYKRCQAIDEWSDSPHDGTSVRAAYKVAQKDGWIGEYRWGFTVDPIIYHNLMVGPVQIGILWTTGMEEIDSKGFIRATGDIAGGHSVDFVGVNTQKRCSDGTTGAFRILNSWGPWGQKGLCWISFSDFAKLLAEDGEAAVAMELLNPAI